MPRCETALTDLLFPSPRRRPLRLPARRSHHPGRCQYVAPCLRTGALRTDSALTSSAVVPLFILPGIFIGCIYVYLTKRYVQVGRDLKRMESIALSPVLSSFSAMLGGVVTVRAFSAEPRFFKSYQVDFDKSRQMWWWQVSSNRERGVSEGGEREDEEGSRGGAETELIAPLAPASSLSQWMLNRWCLLRFDVIGVSLSYLPSGRKMTGSNPNAPFF